VQGQADPVHRLDTAHHTAEHARVDGEVNLETVDLQDRAPARGRIGGRRLLGGPGSHGLAPTLRPEEAAHPLPGGGLVPGRGLAAAAVHDPVAALGETAAGKGLVQRRHPSGDDRQATAALLRCR